MQFIGFLLPALIDLINKYIKNSDARLWTSILVCSIVGVGINYLTTGFAFGTNMEGFESLTGSIMAMFGMAQLTYKAYKGSNVQNIIRGNTTE